MSDDEGNPPILYTSYEDWHNFCYDGIVLKGFMAKYHEIFSEKCSREEGRQLSYCLIELLQLMERRDDCYKLIDERIRRRYNFAFPKFEILKIMSDKNVFYAAKKFFDKEKTKYKEALDSEIDYHLFGVKTPDDDSSDKHREKYKRCLREFKKDNAEFTIKAKSNP